LFVCSAVIFAFMYVLCPRNDRRLESVAMYDKRYDEIA